MSNLRTIVVGVVLLAMLFLGVWLYQNSSANQEVNNKKDQPKSQPASTAKDASSRLWTVETTIGTIVAESPQTARVLELVGIDYCCGGQTPLGEAAMALDIDPTQLLSALVVVGSTPAKGDQRDWQQAEIGTLIDHIVSTHHAWLRRKLPSLTETTETVLRVHGDSHAELVDVAATLSRIREAVLPHLDEEEQHVFPALREIADGNPSAKITGQLEAMRTDHDALGEDLHRLRELTKGFAVPEDACAKYREMLTGLSALERDMHQHVHLENNILLPRVVEMLGGGSEKQ